MRYTILLVAATSVFAMPAAHAADVALGVVGGTAGPGVDLTFAITDNLNLRGTARGLSIGHEFTEDNVRYDGDLKLGNGGVMLDWLPFSGGFRLSLGLMYNGNKVKARAVSANNQFEIGNATYQVSGQVNADIDWRNSAPYLGLGWGNPVRKGTNWGLSLDLGVMFMGSPRSKLSASGTYNCVSGACVNPASGSINLNDPNNPFSQDIQREKQNFDREIRNAKYWPVVQIGLHYHF